MFKNITVNELHELLASDDTLQLLDVRDIAEFELGHVPHALPMPLAIVPLRANEIRRSLPVYTICETGGRSAQAARWLSSNGYEAINVRGGVAAWREAGLGIDS
jgi:rhodanese-related sulfurtransferase